MTPSCRIMIREKKRSDSPPVSQSQLLILVFLLTFIFLTQEAERQKEEAEEQLEDEEGWVKVTRGKSGTKTRPHSEVSNQKALQKESRKRKRKELMNFYTWQHRNTQKERKLWFQSFDHNRSTMCEIILFFSAKLTFLFSHSGFTANFVHITQSLCVLKRVIVSFRHC